jgi:alpha-L-fucosidase
MPSQQILKEVGAWMQKNSESIYGCGNSELLKPEWGYFTQKGRTVFAHWTNPKIGYINIKGYADKVETVSLLASGEEATTATRWWGNEDVGNFFINIKEPVYHTFQLPDETNTVFKIILR